MSTDIKDRHVHNDIVSLLELFADDKSYKKVRFTLVFDQPTRVVVP